MMKFLKFNTANGVRILNVDAFSVTKVTSVNELQFLYVPTNTVGAPVVRKLTRVAATGDSFDAELMGYINDAIIRASQNSYTEVLVEVNIPSKYAIEDLITA